MMDGTYEYAIIRVVPEAYRGEQVNVGVLVFAGADLDIRLDAQPALLRAFGVDPATVDWLPDYLRKFDDPELPVHSRWLRLANCPGVSLSELGWLTAETAEQYHLRVERVVADYTQRKVVKPATRQRSTSIVREMKSIFQEYHIMGKRVEDVDRHKVVSNMPVGPAGKLHVDFVVKNGVYHATETADFRSSESVGIAELKEAALVSTTLQCAREQLGSGDTKCYLVYSAPLSIENAISPALQIAERGVDHIFNLLSGDQRRDYFDLMLAAAGSPGFFGRN